MSHVAPPIKKVGFDPPPAKISEEVMMQIDSARTILAPRSRRSPTDTDRLGESSTAPRAISLLIKS
ncbi:hypothetical protein [Merismopedia glauca]|uniref:hypothetical protein n=1 Tax=Merismopedia glauca TaxID=292586 RepID=UPI0011B1D21D|nr:hypothetical protein [Merismopedia glauca]